MRGILRLYLYFEIVYVYIVVSSHWSTAWPLTWCEAFPILATIVWSLEVAIARIGESPKIATVKVRALLGAGFKVDGRSVFDGLYICCAFVASVILNEVTTPRLNHIWRQDGCCGGWETSTLPCQAHHLLSLVL